MLSVGVTPAKGEDDVTLVANTYAAYTHFPDAQKLSLEGIHALEASLCFINPVPSVAELPR